VVGSDDEEVGVGEGGEKVGEAPLLTSVKQGVEFVAHVPHVFAVLLAVPLDGTTDSDDRTLDRVEALVEALLALLTTSRFADSIPLLIVLQCFFRSSARAPTSLLLTFIPFEYSLATESMIS